MLDICNVISATNINLDTHKEFITGQTYELTASRSCLRFFQWMKSNNAELSFDDMKKRLGKGLFDKHRVYGEVEKQYFPGKASVQRIKATRYVNVIVVIKL